MSDVKWCTGCWELKRSDRFSVDKSRDDGLQVRCKDCNARYYVEHKEHKDALGRAWYRRNAESISARQRERRAANGDEMRAKERQHAAENRERIRARQKAYRLAHAEEISAWERDYKAAHREHATEVSRRYRERNGRTLNERTASWRACHHEHHRAYQRQWYERNRAAVYAYNRARQHTRRAAGPGITRNDISDLYQRQRGRCYWCNEKVGSSYHLDHVIPIARGGPNSRDNIVVSCPQCNMRKHTKLPWEFALRIC